LEGHIVVQTIKEPFSLLHCCWLFRTESEIITLRHWVHHIRPDLAALMQSFGYELVVLTIAYAPHKTVTQDDCIEDATRQS